MRSGPAVMSSLLATVLVAALLSVASAPVAGAQAEEASDPPTSLDLSVDRVWLQESGGSVAVTATLDAPAPAGGLDVVLVVSPDGTADAGDLVLPGVFTIAGGETSAGAVVDVVDDNVAESRETAVLSADAGPGITVTGSSFFIVDDDFAYVRVDSAAVSVVEGGVGVYSVVLDSEPVADVVVTATVDDPSVAAVGGPLTFTAADWGVPQTVAVTGAAAGTATVSHTVASDDYKYAVLSPQTVEVTVTAQNPGGDGGSDSGSSQSDPPDDGSGGDDSDSGSGGDDSESDPPGDGSGEGGSDSDPPGGDSGEGGSDSDPPGGDSGEGGSDSDPPGGDSGSDSGDGDEDPSGDATLSGLKVVGDDGATVTLYPTFTPAVSEFYATVIGAVTSVTVTPTASDSAATITVNGVKVASGSASASITLGRSTADGVAVVVTAADGTVNTYTVFIGLAATQAVQAQQQSAPTLKVCAGPSAADDCAALSSVSEGSQSFTVKGTGFSESGFGGLVLTACLVPDPASGVALGDDNFATYCAMSGHASSWGVSSPAAGSQGLTGLRATSDNFLGANCPGNSDGSIPDCVAMTLEDDGSFSVDMTVEVPSGGVAIGATSPAFSFATFTFSASGAVYQVLAAAAPRLEGLAADDDTAKQVTLSWTEPDECDGASPACIYEVRRKRSDAADPDPWSWTAVTTTSATVSEVTTVTAAAVTELESGVEYTFEVRARQGASGSEELVAEGSVTATTLAVPLAPVLTVTRSTDRRTITLTWTQPTDSIERAEATGYFIDYSTDLTNWSSTHSSTLNALFTDTNPAFDFYFRVQAESAAGFSAFSSIVPAPVPSTLTFSVDRDLSEVDDADTSDVDEQEVTLTATLDHPAMAAMTVTLAVEAASTATAGDFTLGSTTITIAEGATSGTTTITAVDDTASEGVITVDDKGNTDVADDTVSTVHETVVISASSASPALTASPVTVTIVDDEPALGVFLRPDDSTPADFDEQVTELEAAGTYHFTVMGTGWTGLHTGTFADVLFITACLYVADPGQLKFFEQCDSNGLHTNAGVLKAEAGSQDLSELYASDPQLRAAAALIQATLEALTVSSEGSFRLDMDVNVPVGGVIINAAVGTVDIANIGNPDLIIISRAVPASITAAGVVVTADDPVEVAAGGTATYSVVLGTEPTHDVTVTATSDAIGRATVSPASVVFSAASGGTPSDWDTPKTFTVTGVAEGTATISHAATSTDSTYAITSAGDVDVTVAAALEGLAADTSTDNQVTLSWTEPSACSGASPACLYEVRHKRTTDADPDPWGWTETTTSSNTAAGVTTITAAPETGLDSDTGYTFEVRARQGAVGSEALVALGSVSTVPLNARPRFPAAAATRSVAENTPAGGAVGAPVVASDDDDTALVYSLSGAAAASFGIDASTGQITVGEAAVLDHESGITSYALVVGVSDSRDDDGQAEAVPQVDAAVAVTVTVTDAAEVSAAQWTTQNALSVVVMYATRDGGGLYGGDTYTVELSGEDWKADSAVSVKFCVPAAWNDIGDVASLSCTGEAASATADGSGEFSALSASYVVPSEGMPATGLAAVASGTDLNDDTAVVALRVVHAAGQISVTALTGEQRKALVDSGAGATHDFTPTGSRWVAKPALILCRVPYSADPDDPALALRQIVGRSYENFCATSTVVQQFGVLVDDNGDWANDAQGDPYTVTYTVPSGGVAPYGIALSAGDIGRQQGQAVTVVPAAPAGSRPSLSVAAAERSGLNSGDEVDFEVSGSGWTAGGEVAYAFFNGGWPQGPVKAEFCTIPDGGLAAIDDSHCDTDNAVTVTVPTEAPNGSSGWTLGDLAVELTYTVPDGGAPEGGVAIRVRREVANTDREGPDMLEAATAVAIPKSLKVLVITPNQTTRVYGDAEDLGFTVGGLDPADAVGDVISGDKLSRTSGDDAGTYTLSLGSLSIKSAFQTKYALPAAPATTTYTITKKPVTYSSTAADKVYDGTTAAPADLAGSFSPALVGADVVTVTGGSYASKNVADGVAVTGAAAGGADVANYTVTVGTVTGDITAKAVSVAAAVLTRAYDGTTAFAGASLSGGAVSGAVSGESFTLAVTGATFGSKDAATGITLTGVAFSLTPGASTVASNYMLPASITATGTITKKEITAIGGVTAVDRDWDGTTAATFDTSAATGTGVLSGEVTNFQGGGLQVAGTFPAAAATSTGAGSHSLSVTYSLTDAGSGTNKFTAANYMIATAAQTATLTATLSAVAPSAPQSAAAEAADEAGKLDVTWAAPARSGGAAVSGYRVRWRTAEVGTQGNPGHTAAGAWQDASGDDDTGEDVGDVLKYTISGLTAGTVYDVAVAAVNTAGTGSFTAAVQAAPAALKVLVITPNQTTRVYGDSEDLGFTVGGLDMGDAAADVVSGDKLSRTSGDDAGSYTLSLGSLSIKSAFAGEYALPAAPATETYTITAKEITAIGGVSADRDWDGTTAATFDTSAATGTGVLSGELAGFQGGGLQVSGTFPAAAATSTGAGSHSLSVTYSLTDAGSGAGMFTAANYMIATAAQTATLTATIAAVAPGAPGSVAAAAGPEELEVTWAAPASSGGAAVSGYRVRWRTAEVGTQGNPGHTAAGAWQDASGDDDTGEDVGDVLKYTISGLTAGTVYDIAVAAVNTAGTGSFSAAVQAAPEALSPSIRVCAGPSAADDCAALAVVPAGAQTFTVKGAAWTDLDGPVIVVACLVPASGDAGDVEQGPDCDQGPGTAFWVSVGMGNTKAGSQDLGDPHATVAWYLGSRMVADANVFAVDSDGSFSVDMAVNVPAAGIVVRAASTFGLGADAANELVAAVPALAGLAADASTANQVSVSWTEPSACDGASPACIYELRHKKTTDTDPDPWDWTTASTSSNTVSSVTTVTAAVTGLDSGAGYTFVVRARQGESGSETLLAQSQVTATTLDVPLAPTALTATPNSQKTSYVLAWTAPATDSARAAVTGYDVEWSANGRTGWTRIPNAVTPADPTVGASATTHTQSGLSPNTVRHYRVIAASAAGPSEPSEISPPLNAKPRFPAATATRSVVENTPAGEAVGAPVAASDDDDTQLTYSLGGADAASFDIDAASGQITTKAALDFESQASYEVTVSVHDGRDDNGDTEAVPAVDASVAVTINVVDAAEASVAPWRTVGVSLPLALGPLGGNKSTDYPTRDGGGLGPGDTHDAVVSGNGWEASASLGAQFCAVPESGDLSEIDGSSGCVDASPATVTADSGGAFSAVALTYTVPEGGVPEHGVAVRISGRDSRGDDAAAVVAAIHAAGQIDVTLKAVVRGGTASGDPASEDLTTLGPGDTATFTARGSKWIVAPSAIMCRVPEGGRDAQDALRQLNGRNYANFCDSDSIVGGFSPLVVTDGAWEAEVVYTVPAAGVAPYGIALSVGDQARIQGRAVVVVPAKADTALPSLAVSETTTAENRADSKRVFEVSGSGWTAGGSITAVLLGGTYPQGPVKAEFCTIPEEGIDAIDDSHCDTANSVDVTVPTTAPDGATGWSLGDLTAAELVYTVPAEGAPDGGVAIRVRRLVDNLDIAPETGETHLTAQQLQGPTVLESAAAVAIPKALKVLTITPNQTTRVYGASEDLGFTVGGLDVGDAAADVVSGTALSRTPGDDAGTYTLSLDGLSIKSAFQTKYALPAAPATETYTITKKEITAIGGVTAVDRDWDGTTAASFDTSSATGTGVLSGEVANFQGGGLQVSGAFPAAAATSTGAGSHSLSVTYSLTDAGSGTNKFTAANYSLATAAQTATLTATLSAVAPSAPQSAAAEAASEAGKLDVTWAAPAQSGGAAVSGYRVRWRTAEVGTQGNPGHTAAGAWQDASGDDDTGEDVGDVLKYTISGLTAGTVYDIAVAAVNTAGTGSFTTPVQAAPAALKVLVITPNQTTRVYGDAEDLGFTVGGLDPSDAAADVVSGTTLSRTSGDDAGTYTLSLDGLSIKSAFAGEYALPAAPATETYTITAKEITAISGVTAADRDWDGTTAATFDTSAATGTGVLSGELANFQGGGLQVSGAFPAAAATSTGAGSHSLSVTYSLTDAGSGTNKFTAANYSLATAAQTATLTATITAVAPGAPGSVAAAAGPEELEVTWAAPASSGGAAVSGYRVRWRTAEVGTQGNPGHTAAGAWQDADGADDTGEDVGDVTSYTISGLTAGTVYDVAVATTNTAGTGSFSSAVQATPEALSPSIRVCAGPSAGDDCTALTTVPAGAQTFTVKGENWVSGSWGLVLSACLPPGSGTLGDDDFAKRCSMSGIESVFGATAVAGSQTLTDLHVTGAIVYGFCQSLGCSQFSVSGGAFSVDLAVDVPSGGAAVGAAAVEGSIGSFTASGAVYELVTAVPALAAVAADASTANQVSVSWTEPSACDGASPACVYELRYKKTTDTDPDPWDWTAVAPTSATVSGVTTLTVAVPGLDSGVEYVFMVRARQGESGSEALLAQSQVTATTLDVPLAPTALTATPNSQRTSYVLAWTAPATDSARAAVTGYDVEWSANGRTGWTRIPNATTPSDPTVGASATGYTQSGLTSGTVRHYRVIAVSAAGPSEPSEISPPLNAKPAFVDDAAATRSVAENTPAGEPVGAPVVASDDDDTSLVYSLSGADAASFDIDAASGQITVGDAAVLDHESGTTSYALVVAVSDSRDDDGEAEAVPQIDATIAVTVTVTDVAEVSVAAWRTTGVILPPGFGGDQSTDYATRDGGGLYGGDTYTAELSGEDWKANSTVSVKFCEPAAWNDIGDPASLTCTGEATSITADGSGEFSAESVTYTVPTEGMPATGLAAVASGTDLNDDTAVVALRVVHAAGQVSVTALTKAQRDALAPAGSHDFTATGSRWLVSPSLILCRVPQGGLREITGRNFGNFCSSGTIVAFAGVVVDDNGDWANDAQGDPYTVTYTVPSGGVAPYGIALSAGDRARIQGQAVVVVPARVDTEGRPVPPSLSVTAADRSSLTGGGTADFSVSGSGWTAGGTEATSLVGGGWPQGPVKAEFCTIPDGGLAAIDDSHCDTDNAVTVAVPTEAPNGSSGWTLGDLAVELTYTVPDGGAPEGGVAIRVRREVADTDLEGPKALETATAVAIPKALKVLTITPNQTTRVYGDSASEDLGFSVGGLDPADAAADVISGTALSRTPGDDAGTYTLSLDGLSIKAAFQTKYALPAAPATETYTITAKEITAISGVTAVDRDWDGTTAATFDTSAATGTGVLSGELANFQGGGLQVSGTFPAAAATSTGAGSHSLSVTYSLTDAGSGTNKFTAANYMIASGADTATLTATLSAVAPSQPQSAAAEAADEAGKLDVTWAAPAQSGGAAVSGYRVRWRTAEVGTQGNPGHTAAGAWQDASGDDDTGEDVGDVTSYTISGLTAGTVYDVAVAATNTAGTGSFTAAVQAAPAASKTFEITSSATVEEGSSATLTVTLSEAAPTGGVKFDVSAAGSGTSPATVADDLGTVPESVTVAGDANTATVTVPVVRDRVTDPDETFTVTVAPATGVTGWSAKRDASDVALDTATVTITDNTPVVSFGQDRYTFRENARRPTVAFVVEGGGFEELIARFSVTISAGDTASVSDVRPGWFRDFDYSVPKDESSPSFRFLLNNDRIDEDEECFTVGIEPSRSYPGVPSRYAVGSPSSAKICIQDNDTAGLVIEESPLEVVAGSTADYTVKLNSQPTQEVTVAVSSSATAVASASESTLTFTTSNWNNRQTVTVTGAGLGWAKISHTVTSDDSKYSALTAAELEATVRSAGFVSVCDRTPAVRDAIVAALVPPPAPPGVLDPAVACESVNVHDLAKWSGPLSVARAGLSALSDGDFDGLTALTILDVSGNSLTALPDLDEMPSLTTLYAAFNQLSSVPSLSANTALTTLDVSYNRLSSAPDLSANTALTVLDVSDNRLSSVPSLSANTALTVLDVSGNSLSSVPSLSANTALTRLYLSNNSLSSVPSLSANTALTHLVVSDNNLSSVPSLSANTALTVLDVSGNRLSSAPDLSANTALIELSMFANRLSGTLRDLSANDKLQHLIVSQNQLSSLGDLSSLTALATLDASANALSSTPDLSANTALEVLDLSDNQLASTPGLSTNTALEALDLSNNQLASTPDLSANTALEVLDLSANALTTPPAVSAMTSLFALRLHHNALSSLPALSANTALRSVWVGWNNVTSLPSGWLAGLPAALDELHVEGMALTAAEKTVLRTRFTALRRLHAGATGLDSTEADALLDALPAGLLALSLDGNDLSGATWSKLGRLGGLLELDVTGANLDDTAASAVTGNAAAGLEKLRMGYNALSSVPSLSRLGGLRRLHLDHNSITEAAVGTGAFTGPTPTSLTVRVTAGNPAVTSSDAALGAAHGGVTFESPAQITSLQVSKTVTATPASASHRYGFTLSCLAAGDTTNTARPHSFTLADDDQAYVPVHATGLLVGSVNADTYRLASDASCTLTETDRGGAVTVTGLFEDQTIGRAGHSTTVDNDFTALTALTITPNQTTRAYGDSEDLGFTVGGLDMGDAAGDVVSGTMLSRTPGDDAGTYTLSLGALSIKAAFASKYTLPAAPATATYTITRRQISAISGVTVADRDWDGTTTATFDTSSATGTGVLSGEAANFRGGGLQVSGAFPAAAATATGAGSHSVSVTYSLNDAGSGTGKFTAANYMIATAAQTATLTGTIAAVAPSAPQSVAAAVADEAAKLDVTWAEPARAGGAAVTGYRVRWRTAEVGTQGDPSYAAAGAWQDADGDDDTGQDVGNNLMYTISDLTVGTLYDVAVAAANSAGTGSFSAPAQATPAEAAVAGAPDAPSVSRGDSAELVAEWQAPSEGGSTVTGYELRHSKDGADWTEVSGTVTGKLWTTIGGLDNGDEYQIQVRAVNAHGSGPWSPSGRGTPAAAPYTRIETVVTGLSQPWGLAFAPDGTMIFTERGGRLSVRHVDGTVSTVAADLSDLLAEWETGLMGLVVDPDFADNSNFYTCQGHLDAESDPDGSIQVVKWSMNEDYTAAERVADPLVGGIGIGAQRQQAGCRLRFGPQGHLWIATGDGYSTNLATGIDPQSRTNLNGKVLRVDKDTGEGVEGNPFYSSDNAATKRIYTYGHRNPQGLARRPGTGQMWSVEHGTDIDDEINLLAAGGNYGYAPFGHAVCGDTDPFPTNVYCIDAPMTDLERFPAAVEARWSSGDPTLATSGGIFLEGGHWGAWEGRMAVAALRTRSIFLFNFTPAGEFVSQYREPESEYYYNRLRTPMMGPDGALYFTTSDHRSDADYQHNDLGIDEIKRLYVYDYQADAALADLALTGSDGRTVELSPDFVEGITRYTASVERDVTSVTATPYTLWSAATVTVNGEAPSTAVELDPGPNTVSVKVVAADGETTRTYTIEVTRDASAAVAAGVTVSAETLSITEEMMSGTYTVRLDTRPTSPVRIVATSTNQYKVRVTPQLFDIRPAYWDRPYTFFVEGLHDWDAADEEVVITHTVQPYGSDYQNVEAASVTVTVTDKHTPSVVVSHGSLEPYVGATAGYRVYLNAEPSWIYTEHADGFYQPFSTCCAWESHTVTIEATSSDLDVATVSPATVTFTAGGYDEDADAFLSRFFQYFTVTGVAAGSATITHTISGTDPTYTDAVTPVVVSQVGVTVSEPPARQQAQAPQQAQGPQQTPQQAPQQTQAPDGLPSEAAEPVRVPAPGSEQDPVPGPVEGMRLSATADSLKVSWSAPATGDRPTSYVLRLNEVGRGKGKLKTLKPKRTSVTYRGLEAGKTYKVWIRAKNGAGNGPRTFTVVTLPDAPPDPDQPQDPPG